VCRFLPFLNLPNLFFPYKVCFKINISKKQAILKKIILASISIYALIFYKLMQVFCIKKPDAQTSGFP